MAGDRYEVLRTEGKELFAKKDYSNAAERYTSCIQLNPSDHVMYSNRSACYALLGKNELALRDALTCISIQKDWGKGYSRAGFALRNLGRFTDAVKVYTEGLKFNPENEDLKNGFLCAKLATDRPFAAEDELIGSITTFCQEHPKYRQYIYENPNFPNEICSTMKLIRVDPASHEQLLKQCSTRVREVILTFLEMGEQEVEKLERQNSDNGGICGGIFPLDEASAHKERGNMYYKKRMYMEALFEYDVAITLNKDDITYPYNKAAVYIEMGEYDKCIEECEKIIASRYEKKVEFGKIAKVFSRMAVCYEKTKQYDKAIEMYEKSLLEDNNRHVRNSLRDIQRLKEKHDRDAYLDPVKAQEHKEKGNEYFKTGIFPEAKQEYDEAIKRDYSDSRLYANRAAALVKLGEFPSAMKDCEKALELDPMFVKAWIRKASIHVLLKEYQKALTAYGKALDIDPKNQEALGGRFNLYTKIQETVSSKDVDEEQQRRAMADPEIQQILGDPQFQMILRKLTENPMSLQEYMKDSKVANAIAKLMAAGVLRTT